MAFSEPPRLYNAHLLNTVQGMKIQPEVFADQSFFEPPWSHGRPCLRDSDTKSLQNKNP